MLFQWNFNYENLHRLSFVWIGWLWIFNIFPCIERDSCVSWKRLNINGNTTSTWNHVFIRAFKEEKKRHWNSRKNHWIFIAIKGEFGKRFSCNSLQFAVVAFEFGERVNTQSQSDLSRSMGKHFVYHEKGGLVSAALKLTLARNIDKRSAEWKRTRQALFAIRFN